MNWHCLSGKKSLSIILIVCLAFICLLVAILTSVHIIEPVIPLSGEKTEAFFYVRNSNSSSDLSDCTCIGDGLLSNNEIIDFDEDLVNEHILTAPDYSNYLPSGSEIVWDTVEVADGNYVVIGSILSDENKPTVRTYEQQDNYQSAMTKLRSSIKPSKTYYVSNSGNDKYDGLSPQKPKRYPENLIKNGNCTVLLKSGETFVANCGFTCGDNTVISTYGGDDRAVINIAHTSKSAATLYDSANHIYAIPLDMYSKDIGWLGINGSKDWKRVLSNKLVNENEYYVDRSKKTVYVKTNVDIAGQKITYSSGWNGINIAGKKNIAIENIELANAGVHGISITNSSNVLVTNCYIHDIGGAIQDATSVKFGNGIEIWADNCNNILVYKNIVTDCFDAGFTAQIDTGQTSNSSKIIFANNLVERSNYGFECFHSSTKYTLKNCVVEDNIFYDIKDITNGYRLTQSSTIYTGFLCLWSYNNSSCDINIKNNLGFKSQVSAISYSGVSNVTPPINYSNNLFVTETATPIKNAKFFTGKNDETEQVTTNSMEYKLYNKQITNLRKQYSLKKLCN